MKTNGLLISTQIVKCFNKIIKKEFYNKQNFTERLLISIINKVNNNNVDIENSFDERKLTPENYSWIMGIEDYISDYIEKKHKAKYIYWTNVYNKKIREKEEVNWNVEDKMKNFSIDYIILPKDICISICKGIIKYNNSNSFILPDNKILSHLFLKICSYLFKEENYFLQNEILNFDFDSVSIAYFLHLKKTIDICSESYNNKVKMTQQKREEKRSGGIK